MKEKLIALSSVLDLVSINNAVYMYKSLENNNFIIGYNVCHLKCKGTINMYFASTCRFYELVTVYYLLDIRKNAPCQQGRTSLHQSHKQAVSLESKLKDFSCLDHQLNWAVF